MALTKPDDHIPTAEPDQGRVERSHEIVANSSVTIEVPYPVLRFIAEEVPRFIDVVRELRDELRIDEDKFSDYQYKEEQRRRDEDGERRRREQAIAGRHMSRALKRRQSNGEKRYDVLKDLAAKHGFQVYIAQLLVADHRRNAKQRYERFRNRMLLRLANQGLTNQKIADQLGMNPQYVGRLLRKAFEQQRDKVS